MITLIKNGRVINPATKTDKICDVLINGNIIEKIAENISDKADKIIDAEGMWVTPGLIDVHVHLREPGFEYKETIKTGTRSAAKGGFTTICCMPNTEPVIDNEIMVEYIKMKAEKDGIVNVLPIGAITKRQKGEELSNIGKMANCGICGISEDGKSVLNSGLLKTAMKYAKMFDIPVIAHCEDQNLAGNGCMNAGKTAELLGLKGISNDSESIIVARDIILAASTKTKLHICHVSTKESVQILREAHQRGENVTAETCPHYFTLTETAVEGYNSNAKMNPPLRAAEDVEEIKKALKDGTLAIIATDHAPHSFDEKNCEFERAANGIVGLETALPISITKLVNERVLSPTELIEKMSYNPAKMLGIDKGNLSEGKIADITIINPSTQYVINSDTFESKGKNTPFNGFEVFGRAEYTIVNGRIIVENCEILGGL